MKCECGLTFNPHCQRERQRHEERHDEYLRGPVLPEIDLERAVGSISGWPVTECAATDSEGHRANHAKLAKVAQRETSQFPAGYYGTVDEGDFDRRAYAVIKDQRGIALLFSQQVQRSWPAEWRGSEIYLHHDHADVTKMRAIQRVWVAADFRRQGIATKLVFTVLRHLNQDLADIGWEAPFTDAGEKLLRALCPVQFRLTIADAGQLHDVVAGAVDDS